MAPVTGVATTTAARPAWLGPVGAAAALAGASAIVAAFDPATQVGYPPCPLRLLTGLDCPLCGSLRGTHALLTGHPGRALDHDVALVAVLPIVAVVWALWLARTLGWTDREIRMTPRLGRWLVGIGLVWTVVRNLPIGGLAWLGSG
jgi:hypothetical protein